MTETPELPAASHEIVARPDRRYRGKHLLFAIIMVFAGFWFAYDGWIAWPRHNREVHAVERGIDLATKDGDRNKVQELKNRLANMDQLRSELSLMIQRVLAVSLPILGILYGAWTMATARGQYRLVGQTLMMPGLDPIDFAEIRRMDKTRWDRKGIAIIHYRAHDSVRDKTVKLDDFAYERKPTDEIFDRIEACLATRGDAATESASQ